MRGLTMSVVAMAILGAPVTQTAAQTPPKTTRTVIAATTLASVVAEPLRFRLLSVTLTPGQSSTSEGGNGVVYQVGGSTRVSVGGVDKTLSPGEGMFMAAGQQATLMVEGGNPSTILHFLLVPATGQDQSSAVASAKELYQTAAIPDLRAGTYDLNFSRITFPPGMASNAPHHRSGAALYYVVSGTGANTIDGKTEAKPPGSVIYEPFGLVHQWGDPGAEPFTFLVFDINPSGTPAVLPDAPKRP